MKKMRKLLSIMLAMVMILAMSLPVFAEDAETPATDPTKTTTLTINTAKGHTYEIYQVLKGDVSGLTDGEGTLANIAAGANLDTTKVTADAFATAAKAKEDTALAKYASENITGTAYDSVEGDGTAQTVNVAPGYYVVKDVYTDGGKTCAAYMVAVVGPTEMSPKTSTTDIDKNIVDTDANKALEAIADKDAASKKTDTAAIGDVIKYESTSTVPVTEGYNYYYYVVSDEMSKGLTYNKDLKIKIGKTTLGEDEYTLTETDHGFKLVVKDMKKYTAGDAIVITYSATVNKDAEIGLIPNTNKTKLTYSNNPEDTFNKNKNETNEPGPGDAVGVTPDKITKTYVTQLTIQKTDGDEGEFIPALADAEFTLSGKGLNDVVISTETTFEKVGEGEIGEYYLLNDGTYTKDTPVTEEEGYNADKYAETTPNYKKVTKVTSVTDAESGAASSSVSAKVDSNGQIVFTGLNVGEYTLEETKVPTGYNKAATLTFKITAAQDGSTSADEGTAITWSSDNDKVKLDAANGVFDAEIENNKGTVLPSTGGIGTTLFYVIGLILVMGAGIVLVARKRAR